MDLGRVRHLAVLLVVLFLSGPQPTFAQSQISGEAPALKPGEYWVWQWDDDFRGGDRHHDTFRRTVVREDTFEGQAVYILSRGDGTFDVENHDLGTLATIDGSGHVKFRFVRDGDNSFPLAAGKTYRRRGDNPIGKYRNDIITTVVGIEQVSVKAGSFAAWRINFNGNGNLYDGTPYTVSGAAYFAPMAKAWVKTSYSTNRGYHYSEELVSYQVVP